MKIYHLKGDDIEKTVPADGESIEVIIPQTITATDANTLTLTFGSAVSGYAVSGIGGIINVQGRTTQQYFAAATTWSFAHNLGDRYVSIQAFDDSSEHKGKDT